MILSSKSNLYFFYGNKIYFKFNNINEINNLNNIKFVWPKFLIFLIPSHKIYFFPFIVIIINDNDNNIFSSPCEKK